MKTAAAVAIAGVMFMATCVYAQESLSGRYTGNLLVNTQSQGTQSVGLALVIDSVEGGVVKGTATRFATGKVGRGCAGSFPMEGKLEDKKLALHSTGKSGGAGDCSLRLNLSVEGNKLIGTSGGGNAIELSR